MIRINLLPFRAARKKENVRRQISIFCLSLILTVILAFIYNFMLGKQIDGLEKKINDTKKQLVEYNKINQEISEIKKKLAVLNQKIEVIKSLDLNRKEPVQVLQSTSELIVQNRMWLTKFNINESSINLSGIAVDNQTVADYMTRIDNSEYYESVKLSSIKKADIKNGSLSLKTFGLSFNKTKPGKPEEKAGKNEK
jgi:type IV pilus assembly protein PilN